MKKNTHDGMRGAAYQGQNIFYHKAAKLEQEKEK